MVKLGFAKETVRGFIPPGALQGEQLLRIVNQALDRVMAPEDRNNTVATAVAKAGLDAMPDRASELTAFVFGPLRDTVDRAFGAEIAERLLYSLTPFLKQACKHESSAAEHQSEFEELPAEEPESEQPTLPVHAGPPAETARSLPNIPPPPLPPSESEPAPVKEDSSSILVVEHDARTRAQIAHQLRSQGYDVFTAPDGHVALAVCMRNRPDVVISAVELPAVGGRQLIALLRVAFAADAPPVVLLADEDAPAVVDDTARWVSKPVEVQALVNAVEAAMAEHAYI